MKLTFGIKLKPRFGLKSGRINVPLKFKCHFVEGSSLTNSVEQRRNFVCEVFGNYENAINLHLNCNDEDYRGCCYLIMRMYVGAKIDNRLDVRYPCREYSHESVRSCEFVEEVDLGFNLENVMWDESAMVYFDLSSRRNFTKHRKVVFHNTLSLIDFVPDEDLVMTDEDDAATTAAYCNNYGSVTASEIGLEYDQTEEPKFDLSEIAHFSKEHKKFVSRYNRNFANCNIAKSTELVCNASREDCLEFDMQMPLNHHTMNSSENPQTNKLQMNVPDSYWCDVITYMCKRYEIDDDELDAMFPEPSKHRWKWDRIPADAILERCCFLEKFLTLSLQLFVYKEDAFFDGKKFVYCDVFSDCFQQQAGDCDDYLKSVHILLNSFKYQKFDRRTTNRASIFEYMQDMLLFYSEYFVFFGTSDICVDKRPPSDEIYYTPVKATTDDFHVAVSLIPKTTELKWLYNTMFCDVYVDSKFVRDRIEEGGRPPRSEDGNNLGDLITKIHQEILNSPFDDVEDFEKLRIITLECTVGLEPELTPDHLFDRKTHLIENNQFLTDARQSIVLSFQRYRSFYSSAIFGYCNDRLDESETGLGYSNVTFSMKNKLCSHLQSDRHNTIQRGCQWVNFHSKCDRVCIVPAGYTSSFLDNPHVDPEKTKLEFDKIQIKQMQWMNSVLNPNPTTMARFDKRNRDLDSYVSSVYKFCDFKFRIKSPIDDILEKYARNDGNRSHVDAKWYRRNIKCQDFYLHVKDLIYWYNDDIFQTFLSKLEKSCRNFNPTTPKSEWEHHWIKFDVIRISFQV